MLKYIYSTIITALVSGVFITFFPHVFVTEELTLAKALFYVIIVMVWMTLVSAFSRREKKKKESLK